MSYRDVTGGAPLLLPPGPAEFTPAHLGEISWPAAMGSWLGAQQGAPVGGAQARARSQLSWVQIHRPGGLDPGWAAP